MEIIQTPQTELADIEVELFLTALKLRYGHDFTNYAKRSLKRRLAQLTQEYKVTQLSELIAPLLIDKAMAADVVNRITVPLSAFFRDPLVWRYLREQVVPQLATYSKINIWQSGCAWGEETYSLLILLKEEGLLNRVQLIATDINEDSLQRASAGYWSLDHMEAWSKNYYQSGGKGTFSDYFDVAGNKMLIVDELKSKADFFNHNLVVDDVFVEAHLVMCRNVLIYFDDTLQQKAVDLFSRSLCRGGYLVTGLSESLLHADDLTFPIQPVDAPLRIYQYPIRRAADV